jgi:hypothetical protein
MFLAGAGRCADRAKLREVLRLGLGEAEFFAVTAGMIAGGEGLALDGFGRVHAFAVGTLAGLF